MANSSVRSQKSLWTWAVVALLVAHVVVTAAYSLSFPIFEAPDEPEHFAYARFLSQRYRLPVQDTPGLPLHFAAHHPPLYYFILSLALNAMGEEDVEIELESNPLFVNVGGHQRHSFLHVPPEKFPFTDGARAVHILRLISVLMSAGTVLLVYKTASLVFPDKLLLALSAAIVTVSIPQFSYISGMINNDNLANLTCAAALFLLVKILKSDDLNRSLLLWLGAAVGLALLSKLTTIFLLPITLVALLVRREGVIRAAKGTAVVVAVAVAVGGWYYVRNVFVFGTIMGPTVYTPVLLTVDTLFSFHLFDPFLIDVSHSFYALMGWFSVRTYYTFYIAFSLVLLAGICLTLRLFFSKTLLDSFQKRTLFVLGIAILLMLVSLILSNLKYVGNQGRYMYLVISAISLFAVAGFQGRKERNFFATLMLLCVVTTLVLFNVLTLTKVVIPIFQSM